MIGRRQFLIYGMPAIASIAYGQEAIADKLKKIGLEELGKSLKKIEVFKKLFGKKVQISETNIYENKNGTRTIKIDFCVRDCTYGESFGLSILKIAGNKEAEKILSGNRSEDVIEGLEKRLCKIGTNIQQFMDWLRQYENKDYVKACKDFSLLFRLGKGMEKGVSYIEHDNQIVNDQNVPSICVITNDLYRGYEGLLYKTPKVVIKKQ